MSDKLNTLVLESLAEGEKCEGAIYEWIGPRAGHLLVHDALPAALDALENAGLIERYTKRLVPEFSDIAEPQWIYRLTADGTLKQWAGKVSIPEEKSPA